MRKAKLTSGPIKFSSPSDVEPPTKIWPRCSTHRKFGCEFPCASHRVNTALATRAGPSGLSVQYAKKPSPKNLLICPAHESIVSLQLENQRPSTRGSSSG